MYVILINVLGENTAQAEYTFVDVFPDFKEIFTGHGKCLIDKRMDLCFKTWKHNQDNVGSIPSFHQSHTETLKESEHRNTAEAGALGSTASVVRRGD